MIVSQLCEWPPQIEFSLSCVLFSLYDYHHSTHRIANTLHLSYHLRYWSSHNARLTVASYRSLYDGSYPSAHQVLCHLPPLEPSTTTTLHHHHSHRHSTSIPVFLFSHFHLRLLFLKALPVYLLSSSLTPKI